jgi:hypothetical protein
MKKEKNIQSKSWVNHLMFNNRNSSLGQKQTKENARYQELPSFRIGVNIQRK